MTRPVVVAVFLALLTGACELYAGDDDQPDLDAGASVDARPIPDWREAECIALCAPDVGACGPVDECRRSCERAVGGGLPSYCPGGESWRTWECKRLCSSSPGLCPGADQPTCQAECEAWQTNGAYCGAGAP